MELKRKVHIFEWSPNGKNMKELSAESFHEKLKQWDLSCAYQGWFTMSILDSTLSLIILISYSRNWDSLERHPVNIRNLCLRKNTYYVEDGSPYRGTLRLDTGKLEINNRYPGCVKSGFHERDMQEIKMFMQEIAHICGVSEVTFLNLQE